MHGVYNCCTERDHPGQANQKDAKQTLDPHIKKKRMDPIATTASDILYEAVA